MEKIVIAARLLPTLDATHGGSTVFDCTITARDGREFSAWRASPADAFYDACRLAGFAGGWIIPRSVRTNDLYSGRVEFTMGLS